MAVMIRDAPGGLWKKTVRVLLTVRYATLPRCANGLGEPAPRMGEHRTRDQAKFTDAEPSPPTPKARTTQDLH